MKTAEEIEKNNIRSRLEGIERSIVKWAKRGKEQSAYAYHFFRCARYFAGSGKKKGIRGANRYFKTAAKQKAYSSDKIDVRLFALHTIRKELKAGRMA